MEILRNIDGYVESNMLLALIGPSGAGAARVGVSAFCGVGFQCCCFFGNSFCVVLRASSLPLRPLPTTIDPSLLAHAALNGVAFFHWHISLCFSSGKTTLLNALARRGKKGNMRGAVALNGAPPGRLFHRCVGYCEQQGVCVCARAFPARLPRVTLPVRSLRRQSLSARHCFGGHRVCRTRASEGCAAGEVSDGCLVVSLSLSLPPFSLFSLSLARSLARSHFNLSYDVATAFVVATPSSHSTHSTHPPPPTCAHACMQSAHRGRK